MLESNDGLSDFATQTFLFLFSGRFQRILKLNVDLGKGVRLLQRYLKSQDLGGGV